jgi:hypothetical protein
MIQGICKPSCAQGTFTTYPLTVKLSHPVVSHGQLIFTRFSYTFTANLPPAFPRTMRWTVLYSRATSAYGANPPPGAGSTKSDLRTSGVRLLTRFSCPW